VSHTAHRTPLTRTRSTTTRRVGADRARNIRKALVTSGNLIRKTAGVRAMEATWIL
jgi:hypothetical protein